MPSTPLPTYPSSHSSMIVLSLIVAERGVSLFWPVLPLLIKEPGGLFMVTEVVQYYGQGRSMFGFKVRVIIFGLRGFGKVVQPYLPIRTHLILPLP